jgi:5'-nucleotidase
MGLGHVCKNDRPQFVVTGINRGANLGQDLYYSGTVAAAREAVFHGVPALATSLVFKQLHSQGHHYETVAEIAAMIVEAGILNILPPLTLLNLNVPDVDLKDVKGLRFTTVGFRHYSEEIHHREDARGREYFWIAGHYQGYHEDDQSDCHALEQGFAALTAQVLVPANPIDWDPIKNAVEVLHATHFI